MQKRGLSDVVTTVLIILIALVAISILWLFVKPTIVNIIGEDNDVGQAGGALSCINVDIRAAQCSYYESSPGVYSYNIKVQRGQQEGDLSDIRFLFRDIVGVDVVDGSKAVSGSPPDEFGSANYRFDLDSAYYSVDASAVIGKRVCDAAQLPVNCYEETEMASCDFPYGFTQLSDFDSNACIRTRNSYLSSSVRPLPTLGFHNAGPSNLAKTAPLGARIHRQLVSWYQAYNPDGTPRALLTPAEINGYYAANTGIILSIKSNDPLKSTCWFDTAQAGINQIDSYPKNEQEWKDYVKSIVNYYYVTPIQQGKKPVIVGLQLGNEWSHQFAVNSSSNIGCDVALTTPQEKLANMTSLLRITKEAMDEAQLTLPPGEKKLPLLTFGLTNLDNFAMKEGYSHTGTLWQGYFSGNIKPMTANDIDQATLDYTKQFIVNAAPYYDYLDVHIRSNYFYDQGYIAQWIRKVWKDNGITGKGISSTEYGGPFNFYTIQYHQYFIAASLANSLYQGFDSILWAPFGPEMSGAINVNFGLPGMKDWNFNDRMYAFTGYKAVGNLAVNATNISFSGDTYTFYNSSMYKIGELNISTNVAIPDTFKQCEDGLDNDNDELIDGADTLCGVGNWRNDVEFDESGIYF